MEQVCTRRSLVLLAAWLLDRSAGSLFARDSGSTADDLLPRVPGKSKFRSRRYVVNATVILGLIPIFARSKAGGALLTIEECGTGECGSVGLQFGAGSWPERLKGFNRFGMTQEVVKFEHCRIAESAYLSFMTTCRERNFSEAEQAFHHTAERLPVTVACGQSTTAGFVGTIRREAVDPHLAWPDSPQLIEELRGRIAPVTQRVTREKDGPVLPTFLYAVRHALLQGPSDASMLYAHNGEVYRLTTAARRDSRTGEVIVTGRTSRSGVRGESEFKLWMSASKPDLPSRIEFRPKSYLKLTLEADETQTAPVFKRLFEEAQS